MDENTVKSLTQLSLAFKSLLKSVEKSLMTGMYAGMGDLSVRGYRALHAKAVEVLPEDYFVREVLGLELPETADDQQKLAAVSLQAGQMVNYLEGLQRAEQKAAYAPDMDELRNLGRDLQDQILSVTRSTLRRAMHNIDINIARPDAPPVPPVPPIPPEPPKAKRKIEMADDDLPPEDDDMI